MSFELMERNIAEAQKVILRDSAEVARGQMRQRFHFMGQTGWINDPNGLIFFRGKYHVFYQYNPFGSFWSEMYWGHAVSEDLLHWDYLPIALAPSENYDDHPQGGCFSGSAVEKDGRLYLFYTGTANNGNGFEQTQCLAVSDDGIHFTKYEGNPLLTAPEGVPADYFRDPKVWEHEGTYYMVVGGQRDRKAVALLYRSNDLIHWEYFNTLFESRGEWGYMWECSDFFELDGKYVYICSPMGAGERTSVYFIGDFDYSTGRFIYHNTGEIDWGFDFYAPQTFKDAKGRRVMIAWANGWDWMPFWKDWGPTYREGWCGSYCLPREVRLLEDLTLQFKPVEELSGIEENLHSYPDLEIGDTPYKIEAGDGVSYRLRFSLDLTATESRLVTVDLRQGEDKQAVLQIDLKSGELRLDRSAADGWSKGVTRGPLGLGKKKVLDFDIVVDKSSIEVFSDNYRNNHAVNVFASDKQTGLELSSKGGVARIVGMTTCGLKTVNK